MRQVPSNYIHRAIAVILDGLDLDFSSTHFGLVRRATLPGREMWIKGVCVEGAVEARCLSSNDGCRRTNERSQPLATSTDSKDTI